SSHTDALSTTPTRPPTWGHEPVRFFRPRGVVALGFVFLRAIRGLSCRARRGPAGEFVRKFTMFGRGRRIRLGTWGPVTQSATKLAYMASPTFWLFSGWNWQAIRFSRQTIAGKGPGWSASAATSAGRSGTAW